MPNPRNARRHPETQIRQLIASVRRFGQPRDILVRAENKRIIAGHGLWQAMKRAGELDANCLLWDIDQKTADAFMLADNRLPVHAHDDRDRVAELLRGVEPDDLASIGYSQSDVDKLFAGLEGGEISVREVDTSQLMDRFWISVRGPLEHQADCLQAIQALREKYPAIEVELGTITDANSLPDLTT